MFFVLLFSSCYDEDKGALSKGKMADVVYDMQVAQAMYSDHDIMNGKEKEVVALRASILKKYGITEEEWETTNHYYYTHISELDEVYKDVAERLKEDVVAAGGKAEGVIADATDTLNIWRMSPNILLLQHAPDNIVSFELDPGDRITDGDRLNLQYDVRILASEDGRCSVNSYMAITFDNDSVISRNCNTMSNGNGIISLSNEERYHVKQIKGYFILQPTGMYNAEDPQKKRFFSAMLRDIKLLHIATEDTREKEENNGNENNDSIK